MKYIAAGLVAGVVIVAGLIGRDAYKGTYPDSWTKLATYTWCEGMMPSTFNRWSTDERRKCEATYAMLSP